MKNLLNFFFFNFCNSIAYSKVNYFDLKTNAREKLKVTFDDLQALPG